MRTIIWVIITIALAAVMTACTKSYAYSPYDDEYVTFVTRSEEYCAFEKDGHHLMLFAPESDTIKISAKLHQLIADTAWHHQVTCIKVGVDSLDLRYYFYYSKDYECEMGARLEQY